MKIFILNKKSFDDLMIRKGITNDNVEEYKNTFFISINDTCGTDEKPYFENKENVKTLFFDDVEKDLEVPVIGSNEKYVIVKTFTEEQAKDLLKFIDKHKNKKNCFIHCTAGISRSGAVGTFINEYIKGDKDEFKRTNPYIYPNEHVLRLLNQEVVRNIEEEPLKKISYIKYNNE